MEFYVSYGIVRKLCYDTNCNFNKIFYFVIYLGVVEHKSQNEFDIENDDLLCVFLIDFQEIDTVLLIVYLYQWKLLPVCS